MKAFLLQEDMNLDFELPCTIDFKLGTRQWDLTTSEKFRVKLIEKSNVSTSHSLGIRLVAATVYDETGVIKENTTKSQNLRLSGADLQQKIVYLIPKPVRRATKEQLKKIKKAYSKLLKEYPNFRMYSASVLLCFDGGDENVPPKVTLIDFAHAHFDIAEEGVDPNKGQYEDGVLLGFDSLMSLMSI